ncbi:MAG: CheY-P phosphatase CheC [Firmicutes bacterium ADurb.Bin193]|nr:MAG: CheY-P phosphatase CheC [Firmicutes bacterium ADurb.Bin193]
MLTPMQKDVLVELFNIHIGKSASLLSQMVNQKIILSIPEIELISGENLNLFSFEQAGIFESGQAVLSSIKYGKEFSGTAFIVFSLEKARLLVDACFGREPDPSDTNAGLSYEDIDVLKEICNVTLNSIIGEFGNLFDVRIEFMTPEVEFSLITSIDQERICDENRHILVLLTSFFLEKSQVNGLILISLNDTSIRMILKKIDGLLED